MALHLRHVPHKSYEESHCLALFPFLLFSYFSFSLATWQGGVDLWVAATAFRDQPHPASSIEVHRFRICAQCWRLFYCPTPSHSPYGPLCPHPLPWGNTLGSLVSPCDHLPSKDWLPSIFFLLFKIAVGKAFHRMSWWLYMSLSLFSTCLSTHILSNCGLDS